MNSIPICFRRAAAGIAIGLALAGCRSMRENRSESLRTTDSLSADGSLWEIAEDTTFAACRFAEIRFTEFYPPDSARGEASPAPRKEIVLRSLDAKNEEAARTVRRTETHIARAAERQQTVCSETPGKDPYRWRYAFYALCLLSVFGAVRWLRRNIR